MKETSTIKKLMLATALVSLSFTNVKSQTLSEAFDDITLLPGLGWEMTNMSAPIGVEDWVQGYSTLANQTYYFTANSGAAESWICGSFNNCAGAGTISNWLLTPALTINNGDTLSFYTRSSDLAGTVYPDRMQVRMNQSNTNNVGVDETTVGDFTDLLLDINPLYDQTSYPFVWTKYDLIISGVPGGGTLGRFAFRYFVEDGGPLGANSFIVGIDDVTYTPFSTGIPEIKNTTETFIGPNPVINNLNIRLAEPIKEKASLKILNAIGEVVYSADLAKGFTKENLNLAALAKGYYNIYISGTGISIRKSFIKD
ncbi:MAG TPA: choice-of-anchor J domain-containing protein [Bacteroidia bacterium]|nr:choice-of-anchor J domain-containing protein [Bacteroidia bacterium]